MSAKQCDVFVRNKVFHNVGNFVVVLRFKIHLKRVKGVWLSVSLHLLPLLPLIHPLTKATNNPSGIGAAGALGSRAAFLRFSPAIPLCDGEDNRIA